MRDLNVCQCVYNSQKKENIKKIYGTGGSFVRSMLMIKALDLAQARRKQFQRGQANR